MVTDRAVTELYTKENVMSRRFLAARVLLKLYPEISVVTRGAIYGDEINVDALSADQKREIREFAMSYTEKMLVTGSREELWIIVPSVFPSSSFCVALKLYAEPKDVLRILSGRNDGGFVFSSYLDVKASRLSPRLNLLSEQILELCEELRACFCDVYRLDSCVSHEERLGVIRRQCYALSYFTGCPIDLSVSGKASRYCSKVDFSLLSTFLFTMLLSARNNASLREARIDIKMNGESFTVEVGFESEYSVCLACECNEWRKRADDKGMICHFSHSKNHFSALLCPLIDERVYSEIKQKFKINLK